jgi:hypothetical protein
MLPDWLFAGKFPEVIGPFRVLRVLGEGGSGAVFLAERMEKSTQRVAIKILQPGLFPELGAASIAQEERILAALDHPGIVRLLDIGETTQGLRYMVMEYVDGEPLDMYSDSHCLPIRRRIEILLELLDIVEHAHRHLVIHADLKPGSILVTEDGKPSLLDLGIAAILSGKPTDQFPATGFARNFGSPEQMAGERLTPASDIYSLGAIAHSVLTGRLPHTFSGDGVHSAPASASTALTFAELGGTDAVLLKSIAGCRKETPVRFLALIRGDVEAILKKALSINPGERFESVRHMADEFRRYLGGYPIHLRPVGWTARVRKWIRRNQGAAGVALALAAVLIFSILGVASQTAEATRKREQAMTRLHELSKLTETLAGELDSSVHGLPGSESTRAALLQNAHLALEKLGAEEFHDPQFDMEIAEEYEKLARIELSASEKSSEARLEATEDLNRAVRILSLLPSTEPQFSRARQRVPEMIALRDSLTQSTVR